MAFITRKKNQPIVDKLGSAFGALAVKEQRHLDDKAYHQDEAIASGEAADEAHSHADAVAKAKAILDEAGVLL
jgi:hypothetical protein